MTALLVIAAVWIGVVALGWLVVVPLLSRGPGGDPLSGILWITLRVYCRAWHQVRASGLDRIRLPGDDDSHRGLIVVSNHTGAVDPLLIQNYCRFLIRWMMAADMMGTTFGWLAPKYVLPVDRDARDSASLRQAIRYVKNGGAIGVFPEGRITIPPRELRPFLAGVGLMIAKTRAPVLLCWVHGTPDSNKLTEALATRSHARVEFLEWVEFPDERDAAAITESLRRKIADASGWPLNDEIIPPGGPPEPE